MSESLAADPLEDRLCLMLYRSSHAMTAAYREVLHPLGLTYPQYTVISALGRTEAATIKELGDLLDSDYGTMSPLVRRLEAKTYVQRLRGTADEREVLVRLTASGRDLHERTGDVQARIRDATGVSETRRDRLVQDLQNLTVHLRHFSG